LLNRTQAMNSPDITVCKPYTTSSWTDQLTLNVVMVSRMGWSSETCMIGVSVLGVSVELSPRGDNHTGVVLLTADI